MFDRTLQTAPEHKPVLSLCIHMLDVRKTEQVIPQEKALGMPVLAVSSVLHHKTTASCVKTSSNGTTFIPILL